MNAKPTTPLCPECRKPARYGLDEGMTKIAHGHEWYYCHTTGCSVRYYDASGFIMAGTSRTV
jgi:hypothetical protein